MEALRSCLNAYHNYLNAYHNYYRSDDSDDRVQQSDGGGTTNAKKDKNKPAVPPKVLNTAPAKGSPSVTEYNVLGVK